MSELTLTQPTEQIGKTEDQIIVDKINKELEGARNHEKKSLPHYKEVGKLLTQLKKIVSYGNWHAWLKSSIVVTRTQAETYMLLAEHWELVESEATSIRQAVRLIKGKTTNKESADCSQKTKISSKETKTNNVDKIEKQQIEQVGEKITKDYTPDDLRKLVEIINNYLSKEA